MTQPRSTRAAPGKVEPPDPDKTGSDDWDPLQGAVPHARKGVIDAPNYAGDSSHPHRLTLRQILSRVLQSYHRISKR